MFSSNCWIWTHSLRSCRWRQRRAGHEEGEGRDGDAVQQPVATATAGAGAAAGGAVQRATPEEGARGGALQETADGDRRKVNDVAIVVDVTYIDSVVVAGKSTVQ